MSEQDSTTVPKSAYLRFCPFGKSCWGVPSPNPAHAPCRARKKISDMAKCYNAAAEKMFRSWGIPVSYLVFDSKDDLATLIENELIKPEDAGYYACDGERCCEFCDGYYPPAGGSNDEPDEGEDFEEMMSALTSVIHEHFGSNVTVHIVFD